MALISAFPNRAGDFPDPALLRQTAETEPAAGSDLPAHLQADLRDGLHALARSVEAAMGAAPPTVVVPEAEPEPIQPRRARHA
jgi:hypothetical protein